jgi:hypothetical protein
MPLHCRLIVLETEPVRVCDVAKIEFRILVVSIWRKCLLANICLNGLYHESVLGGFGWRGLNVKLVQNTLYDEYACVCLKKLYLAPNCKIGVLDRGIVRQQRERNVI